MGRTQNQYCRLPEPPQRRDPPDRKPEERTRDWNEVEIGYAKNQAEAEASRCLSSITCTYCEVCQLICPDMCITRDDATGRIFFDLEYCKGCGLCAHFCPKGAIDMVREAQ